MRMCMDLECVVGSTDLMLTCSVRLRCEMPVRVGLLLSFRFANLFLNIAHSPLRNRGVKLLLPT